MANKFNMDGKIASIKNEEKSREISTQTTFGDTDLVDGARANTNDEVVKETPNIIRCYYKLQGFSDVKELKEHDESIAGLTDEQKEKEIVRLLIVLGDQLDNDTRLKNLLRSLRPAQMASESFFNTIANKIFEKGKSWGKIAALLALGAKFAIMGDTATGMLILEVVKWVTKYILEYLLSWITESGGWSAITDFVEETKQSMNGSYAKKIVVYSSLGFLGVVSVLCLYKIVKKK